MTSLDRFTLKNKVILLTGGAGLYGRGLTRDLAEAVHDPEKHPCHSPVM